LQQGGKQHGEMITRKLIKSVWKDLNNYQKTEKQSTSVCGLNDGRFEKMPPQTTRKPSYSEAESEFWNTGQLRDKF
jgi:hypothetical protein